MRNIRVLEPITVPVTKDADVDTVFHILDKMEYQGHISKAMKHEVMKILYPLSEDDI